MDNINDRFTLDYESAADDIIAILGEIQVLRSERIFAKSIGAEAAGRIKENESAVKKRLNDKFNLVVIGDFKRGKSTLINAILGDEILPSAVTPETVTINKVSYSQVPKAEAVLENGKRAALDYAELKRDILERLLPQLPSPVDYIDIRANNEMLREITVVDTPGIGDMMNVFDGKIADYLVNADAVVYVVSARAPFSASEQAFLSTAVIPQNFSQMMVVVNMTDMLETKENIEKIRKLTIDRARCAGENIQVYMVSALDELNRKKAKNRPEKELANILEMNFLEFENALKNDIIMQKDLIKTMRAVSLTEILLKYIFAKIELVKNTINMGVENLNANYDDIQNQDSALRKTIDRHKTSVSADIDNLKSEAKKWIIEFFARLKTELQAIQAQAVMQDVQRHFQFYMMDIIKEAVLACVRFHHEEIQEKAAKTIKEMAEETTKEIFGTLNTGVSECIKDISWTGYDTASFVLDSLGAGVSVLTKNGPVGMTIKNYLGVLGGGIFRIGFDAAMLAGQAVMGFLRQKKIAERKTDFIAPVLQELDTILTDVLNNISKIYDQIKFQISDKIDEIYRQQAETSVSAIKQAQEMMQDESEKKEDILSYLDSVLERINGFNETLQKYR
ncbi:MAG: dynamin family protein [Treponema sp.]|nr:dynamin family protein [Treponema sp.]